MWVWVIIYMNLKTVQVHCYQCHHEHPNIAMNTNTTMNTNATINTNTSSIVVTTLDCGPRGPWFKSRVGAVPIIYEDRPTAQGLPEPSSVWSSTSVPEQLNIKAVIGACKLINGCSLELYSATFSVASSFICHRN